MDLFNEDYKITKPLRLIELFAGYGSQAMAFDRIGVKYEHHFVCEFDKYAMKSYNAVHGTNFEPTDIRNIHAEDLNITDTDKYTYFMTYSFPCTDLSLAGKQAGMKKGSGTRSGLLWEVERLLTECKELPQVLFMENVPQVIAEKNMPDFMDWLKFLHLKGYSSYYKVLNAKDYGVPQNRERCFMFSFLGDYDYIFPEPTGLTKLLVDILEDEVDEKYYITSDTAKRLIEDLIVRKVIPTEQNSVSSSDLTCQDSQVELNKSQTALQQDTIVESLNTETNIPESWKNVPCQLMKIGNGEFLSLKDAHIHKINTPVAGTITARYFKGVAGNGDNLVLRKD